MRQKAEALTKEAENIGDAAISKENWGRGDSRAAAMGVGISIWPPHLGNWEVGSLLLLTDSADADRKGKPKIFFR